MKVRLNAQVVLQSQGCSQELDEQLDDHQGIATWLQQDNRWSKVTKEEVVFSKVITE